MYVIMHVDSYAKRGAVFLSFQLLIFVSYTKYVDGFLGISIVVEIVPLSLPVNM